MIKILKNRLVGKAVAIGLLGVVLIFITGIMMAGVYYESQKQLIQQREKQLAMVSNAVAANIESYVQSYMLDLRVVEKSDEFQQAAKSFSAGESNTALCRMLRQYTSVQDAAVSDIYLLDGEGNFLAGTSPKASYTVPKRHASTSDKEYTQILVDQNRNYYLAVTGESFSGKRLMMVLSIRTMYQKTAANIKVDNKGYAMIKTSDGTILMHPVNEQIGEDVILDRKKQHPDFDFSELETLIQHQKEGKTAVEIYHSYWWAEKQPVKVRKISAYTTAKLPDDFFIVSTVTDYDEIAQPFQKGVAKMLTIGFVMILGIGGFLTALIIVVYDLEKNRKKNRYLMELNSTLKEIHKSEEQMYHYQRLQTIGTLTGGIAHEFNNLLTPIMGYSGMLLHSLPKSSSIHDDIEEIYISSAKAKEIIKQISALSRKNSETTFKRFSMEEAVARTIKVVCSIKPENIEIMQNIHLSGCFVMGSETQINQVFLNLCTNAFYAMKSSGGVLRITGCTVEKEEVPQGNSCTKAFDRFVKLVLEDTGSGIDSGILSRIFDPFFTTKEEGEGTGLGLSIAQSIIESHNGKITVSSQKGKGTAFTFYLPVCDAPEKKREIEQPVPSNQFRSILLVDNDKFILNMLRKGLEKSGLSVACFSTPKEALQDLKLHSYEVLVADYSMPEMFGTQLALLAKGMNEQMRIIILTGLVTEEVIESKQKNIIDDYVIKPLVCEELIEKLATLPTNKQT